MSSALIYTCAACKSTYKRFAAYKKHVLRDHAKIDSEDDLDIKPKSRGRPKIVHHKSVTCEDCNKMFCSKYTLQTHKTKYCKGDNIREASDVKGENEGKTSSLAGLTPETLMALTELLKTTMGGSNVQSGNHNQHIEHKNKITNNNQTNNHTNNNNLTNNNNITQNNILQFNHNININPLGQENLDHITKEDKLEILNMGAQAVPALAKAILELPENRNIAICDKKNNKVMFVNRDGKVEISNIDKVVGWFTEDNIGRINSYITEYDDDIPARNRVIKRLKVLQGHDSISSDEEEEHDAKYQGYFDNCSSQLKDAIAINNRLALRNIKKFHDKLEIQNSGIPNLKIQN
jgi:hypothetical protein